ncbi:LADA_0G13432g1_1 [Lachancea dasiensis]|uniref:LADA_0G13432g1_1 n=1 Tax=Lachancea dasiensis TaxID=1072105 RepID=A0A1G4JVP8_9SACH|nr:LADA_0G13432g1_1 [Lachancea dasiensis]
MGNSPSTANSPQNKRVSQLAHEPRSRQDSITSQLFRSRSAGRHPETDKHKQWKMRVLPSSRNAPNVTPGPPSAQSPFRKNYSLDMVSEPAAPSHFTLKKSALGNPAPPMCITTNASADESSSSSLRDHLAELSLQNSEILPSTVTTSSSAVGVTANLRNSGQGQPPHVAKLIREDVPSDHLSSITSLKKLLVEGKIGDQINRAPSSIYIPRRSSAYSDADMSDDEGDEESLLQGSNDVLINNSVLENAMKRKRSTTKKANALGVSWSSRETLQHPGLKKLKPVSADGERTKLPQFKVMHARPKEGSMDFDLNGGAMEFETTATANDVIENTENGSVEHYEGSNSAGSSPILQPQEKVTPHQEEESIDTHVIVKWKDNIVDPKTCKMSIVSKDILAVLGTQHKSKKIPMIYEADSKCWTAPNLFLPPGVYKFQFLINGELRHSDFLPTATDSFGNCVNWFEVIRGHNVIEPSRDVISTGNSYFDHDDFHPPDTPSPRPGMKSDDSSLSNVKGSARHIERTGTPFSDYIGIHSRSGSFRPLLNQNRTSSIDLLAPLPLKKHEYSSEIPELFKANFDEHPDLPAYEADQSTGDHKDRPSFLHRVQDCNQDVLFADLQQDGKLDSQAAEEAFLRQYPTPDLPVYLDSSFLNSVFSRFQKKNDSTSRVNHIVPHVNLNHLLTSSIRDEIISVGCTTRYEGKFITQVIYTPCYYGSKEDRDN